MIKSYSQVATATNNSHALLLLVAGHSSASSSPPVYLYYEIALYKLLRPRHPCTPAVVVAASEFASSTIAIATNTTSK